MPYFNHSAALHSKLRGKDLRFLPAFGGDVDPWEFLLCGEKSVCLGV